MSADGEIEIAVTAEGAEDAAAEVADADPQGGGGGGGGLSGGLGRAGGIGFILSKVLGPIIDVLGPIQKLLEAFLAPVAVVLLRLLQPALRLLIKVLPVWLNFMNVVLGLIDSLQSISRGLWDTILRWVPKLPQLIWDFVKQLPRMIADKLSAQLPRLSALGGDGSRGGGENPIDTLTGILTGEAFTNDRGGIQINLQGGLDQLVENIERETGLDF